MSLLWEEPTLLTGRWALVYVSPASLNWFSASGFTDPLGSLFSLNRGSMQSAKLNVGQVWSAATQSFGCVNFPRKTSWGTKHKAVYCDSHTNLNFWILTLCRVALIVAPLSLLFGPTFRKIFMSEMTLDWTYFMQPLVANSRRSYS